jgi:hypothetical protein
MPGEMEPREWTPDFYQCVGRCIKGWADVEASLFRICHTILNTDEDLAAVVYFRTPTIDAKLQLVDDLMVAKEPKKPGQHDSETIKQWRIMLKEAKRLTPFRNHIAHGPVTFDRTSGKSRNYQIDQHPAEKRRRPSSRIPMDVHALRAHEKDVLKLRLALAMYAYAVGPTPPKK